MLARTRSFLTSTGVAEHLACRKHWLAEGASSANEDRYPCSIGESLGSQLGMAKEGVDAAQVYGRQCRGWRPRVCSEGLRLHSCTSHWEGFIKDASAYYLTYLAQAPLELGKLRTCFLAVALRSELRVAGDSKRVSAHSRFIDLLRSLEQAPPTMRRLPLKGVVSTRSNLKGEVLREITATLGIDYQPFELKETPVINKLVKTRNMIAHGGGIPVSRADYSQLHTEIIALMDVFKDLVQDAVANDRHFR